MRERFVDVNGRTVFISGPMTGLPHLNVGAFAEANQILKEAGAADVYNPAFDYLNGPHRADDVPHEWWIRKCLCMLCDERWDVLVSLPDWAKSDGASVERNVARALGMVVCEIGDVEVAR